MAQLQKSLKKQIKQLDQELIAHKTQIASESKFIKAKLGSFQILGMSLLAGIVLGYIAPYKKYHLKKAFAFGKTLAKNHLIREIVGLVTSLPVGWLLSKFRQHAENKNLTS